MGVHNQVMVFAIAIYVGTLLSQFFTALTRDLVLPLLSPIASVEGGLAKLVVPLGPFKFNVGDVIVNTLNLVIALGMVSLVLPYLSDYVPVAGKR
jgi:large-conductance mechanosensitive channel